MHSDYPQNILITGASSGIGAGLARFYANPGNILHLSGRNQERLNAVSRECEARGAQVTKTICDVTNKSAMEEWFANLNTKENPLDLVIANAGISGNKLYSSSPDQVVDPDVTRDILAVNIAGVVNTVLPAIDHMVKAGRGQIAIVSSLAGYRGLPSTPAYSASKVAVRAYGEALRPVLGPHGIKVNVIMPGFVESRITDKNTYHMPLIMNADKAATIIAGGLKKNKARITFPWPLALMAAFMGILPPTLTDGFLARLPTKD